jgi:pathogenesis-related protein 1
VGENLAAGTRSFDASAAVSMFASDGCKFRNRERAVLELTVLVAVDPSQPTFTHFTQMVWKSTTQLGCGVAVCGNGQIFPDQYGPALYHVCLYDPVGNVIGEEQ